MKKLLALALLCLTLMGCGQRAATSLPNRLTPTKETENDILRCYPLDSTECRFFALGEDLYLIQNEALVRYSGKLLVQTAAYPLEGAAVQPLADGCGCYDPKTRELFLLNRDLEETARISLPLCTQTPILDTAGTRVFYCTDTGLMEGDLENGTHRLLRQMSTRKISLTAWMENTQTLAYENGPGESVYIQPEDGARLGGSARAIASCTLGSRDCLALRCGYNDCLYLNSSLLPLVPGMHFLAFLPSLNSVLVYTSDTELQFSLYDLGTGNLATRVNLPAGSVPVQAAASRDGRIFLLLRQDGRLLLYQWMPQIRTRQDSTICLTPIATQDAPNRKGLDQCRQRAAFLEEKYGIRIALHTAATKTVPSGYTLEPEHLPAIVMDTLDRLEQSLLRLPTDFVRQTVQDNTTVCLVRAIRKEGQLQPYLQYWQSTASYLFIATAEDAADSILRALCPMIDQRVLIGCDAYDTWEALNPSGFTYGREPEDPAAFADSQGAASPTEDRASLLLASISRDNRPLFNSAILQNKLRRMCLAIRSSYTLGNTPLPWEQYLWQPIR